jgi:hypothetical protein
MKTLIYGAAAALTLMTLPALAQDAAKDKATIQPTELMAQQPQRPPLQLDDTQKGEVRAALKGEDTTQKAPKDFQAAVGGTVPKDVTTHAMPPALLQQVPSLKQYGYAKLDDEVLVIDPMKKTIIAILPGAGGGSTAGSGVMEPAGDSGDKPNGTAGSTKKE